MLILALLSCGSVEDTWTPPAYPAIVPGSPVVGAAEGFLKLPVGTPLSGYSTRCGCLSGQSRQDTRDSAYVTAFVPSTGVHTHPTIKVIWIDNGDESLVITKTDSIYSNDKLTRAIEAQLTAQTGQDLTGQVVHTTNHSHASYGDFSDQLTFYLGSDKYNEEIFQRFVQQVVDVAMEAHADKQPAKIGMSINADWDPDDRIYRDRRGANNDAVIGDPTNPLPTGKDPHAVVLRVDSMQDEPIAVLVNFGMHGISITEQSSLVSAESGGGVEAYLTESFDSEVVVMFTQGSGGDASPAGEQEDYARVESIGARSAPLLYDLWATTPTSAEALTLQSASRAIPSHPSQMVITRGGTTDLRYAPYEEGRIADNLVYGDDGQLLSPIDEFNTELGGAFCGTGDLALPVGGLEGVNVPPYDQCLGVETLSGLIETFFDVGYEEWDVDPSAEKSIPLPIPDLLRANTLSTVADGLLVKDVDGTEASSQVVFGFFPGEATHMYNEQFRRRAKAELGVDHAIMMSYSMDHEGYLLIPEDWLLGEYEADITFWGPLSAEHIMEQTLLYSEELLFDDVRQPSDPLGQYNITTYPERSLPTLAPDVNADAGTPITSADEVPETFWVPDGFSLDLDIPATLPRVQGQIQLAWKGGDPGVDDPIVTLEREENGTFVPYTTRTGRPITDSFHDMLKGTTPDPLEPLDAQQDHYWWVVWQAVDHVTERDGLPLGRYRLAVDGKSFDGDAATWPWGTTPYRFESDSFEIVPATLDLTVEASVVRVSLPAHPSGFRYVAAGGDENGANPATGPFQLEWTTAEGIVEETLPGLTEGGQTRIDASMPGATALTVTDAYGNIGSISLL